MIARIADLIQHETAGDPISGLKWTRKTREKVCSELRHLGILVSPNTVGRLLRRMDHMGRPALELHRQPRPLEVHRQEGTYCCLSANHRYGHGAGVPGAPLGRGAAVRDLAAASPLRSFQVARLARSPGDHAAALAAFGLAIAGPGEWVRFGHGRRLLVCPLERRQPGGAWASAVLSPRDGPLRL